MAGWRVTRIRTIPRDGARQWPVQPLRAEPLEIAHAAVFMVSDECRFMTATCLTIDGGLSVRQHG